MNIRDLARADLVSTITDPSGFGQPICLKDPDGSVFFVTGQTGDIGALVDSLTGLSVTGSLPHIAVTFDELARVGADVPVGVADGALKPWLAEFDNCVFKISESRLDKTLGLAVFILRPYKV